MDSLSFSLILAVAVGSALVYYVVTSIYTTFFGPLSLYPGPKTWAASYIPYIFWTMHGSSHKKIKALHDRYGPIVRLTPTSLSYSTAEAWEEITGHVKGAHSHAFQKDLDFFVDGRFGQNILNADEPTHRRMRRLLAHAFSEKALTAQEDILTDYISQFVNGLKRECSSSREGKVNIAQWYNFTTFDVIGDLSFGEPFGCVKHAEYHPWVYDMLGHFKMLSAIRLARMFPLISIPLMMLMPSSLKKNRKAHLQWAIDKVNKRIEMGDRRQSPDFMHYLLRHNDEKGMTHDEIRDLAGTLVIAGSETTATLLTGLTYHLLTNRARMSHFQNHIRTTYQKASDMNLHNLAQDKYIFAVLEEGLRMFPPIPGILPRVSPPGGATLLGQYVPGGTSIGIHQWSTYHSESNFKLADEFHPERWMESGDSEYASDSKKAFQPFSYGPRNCIGKNLAYAESRLLLANVLWHFDLELMPEDNDWIERVSTNVFWAKPPLTVRLTPRKTERYM